ncbi:hypothetical protein AVEN_219418-1 [Araneus ventricosus]|uniref:Uncharacterized protein n=1 Tax=Araneus ventricosus TaxID=182803 RepID=A0A4Y2QDR4_ARAVE|nr:hypothetical protein AVEN_43133-1 [Araneus ventricosus]GBN62335.1 hypothetical protein AVEN_219418-1 [Araneus ventricosus]
MMGPRPYSIDVSLHLNATYGQQWIGRGGPVLWPARSPDLTCLVYFLWGYVKSLVYGTPINSAEDLLASIAAAAGEVRDAYRHAVLEQSTIVTLEGSDWTGESDVTILCLFVYL